MPPKEVDWDHRGLLVAGVHLFSCACSAEHANSMSECVCSVYGRVRIGAYITVQYTRSISQSMQARSDDVSLWTSVTDFVGAHTVSEDCNANEGRAAIRQAKRS